MKGLFCGGVRSFLLTLRGIISQNQALTCQDESPDTTFFDGVCFFQHFAKRILP